MKVGELYASSQKSLRHLPDFSLDVSLIFMKVLGLTRAQLITKSDMQVQEEDRIKIEEMVRRRALFEPMAYIIGSKYFMGLEFYVDKGVLIPRGDTEILCEKALELLQKQNAKRNGENLPKADYAKGLEIGVGSGAISISLLVHSERLLMDAVDLSQEALRVAEKNANIHQVQNRLYLMHGDALQSEFYKSLEIGTGHLGASGDVSKSAFEPLCQSKYDFLISNPPYISEVQKKDLMKDVVEYEPHMALFAKEEGLAFYQTMISHADRMLKEDGFLAFEIGYDQADAVKSMMEARGFVQIEVIKDYEGHDRVVLAWR